MRSPGHVTSDQNTTVILYREKVIAGHLMPAIENAQLVLLPLVQMLHDTNQKLDRITVSLDGIDGRLGRLETKVGKVEKRMGALETRMGALETKVDGFGTQLGKLEIVAVKDINLRRGSGALYKWEVVPFDDSSLPSDYGLPRLNNMADIASLSNADLRQYVQRYGSPPGIIRTTGAKRNFLREAVGGGKD